MEDKIKKDLENENKENLDKQIKAKIPLKINKKMVIGIVIAFLALGIYSFKKAAYSLREEKTPKIEEENNVTTLDNAAFSNNDILVEKEKTKLQKESSSLVEKEEVNKIKEDDVSNNNLDEYILEQIQSKREVLRDYYSRILQEEQDARTSTMSFKNMDSNKDNSLTNQRIPQDKKNIVLGNNDPNKQTDKKNFLNDEEASMYYNSHSLINPISSYEIKAGSIIPGIMITGTISELPGYMVGQVREDVYDTITGNYLLIPAGTRILGKYDSNVTFGQERVLVIWQRLIFPDGRSLGLDNMQGTDLSGYAGFKGKVDNHYFKLLQAVILSSFMGAGEVIITEDKYGDDDWRYEAGRGGGEVILEFGDKMAERILDQPPTIEIPQGYKFNIIVNSDLLLVPYEE